MPYAVELPPEGTSDWGAWSAALMAQVRALTDGDSVTVTVPGRSRPHELRKAQLFGLRPAKHVDMVPWVRVRRDEDHAVCELIGSENFGGEFLLSDEEERVLGELGWREPGPISMEERVWNRWFPDDVTDRQYLPQVEARRAADLVAFTLRDVICAPRD